MLKGVEIRRVKSTGQLFYVWDRVLTAEEKAKFRRLLLNEYRKEPKP
jgi:hypothetical protein